MLPPINSSILKQLVNSQMQLVANGGGSRPQVRHLQNLGEQHPVFQLKTKNRFQVLEDQDGGSNTAINIQCTPIQQQVKKVLLVTDQQKLHSTSPVQHKAVRQGLNPMVSGLNHEIVPGVGRGSDKNNGHSGLLELNTYPISRCHYGDNPVIVQQGLQQESDQDGHSHLYTYTSAAKVALPCHTFITDEGIKQNDSPETGLSQLHLYKKRIPDHIWDNRTR